MPQRAPTQEALVVLRHGETFIKGANRREFERVLRNNIQRAIAPLGPSNIRGGQGRFYVNVSGDGQLRALERLRRVFGISSVSPAIETMPDVDAIAASAVAALRELVSRQRVRSFKVETKRSDKRFPYTSPEVSRDVGAAIVKALDLPVDLHTPQVMVGVEIGMRCTFVFVERVAGAGGLPVGSTGHVALLLSGGIDSPVAGWLAQKRGCSLRAIYFHAPPHTSQRAQDKVEQLARCLAPQQGGLQLHVVRFTAIQEQIRDHAPANMLVVLYRRTMMRIAELIAAAHGCPVLVTGESLGQVASQTLENMVCIQDATRLPILRPLLSYDKQETIRLARHIGTFDVSIEPYDDCCSLFVPKHPSTRVQPKRAQRAEARLDLAAQIEAAARDAQLVEI